MKVWTRKRIVAAALAVTVSYLVVCTVGGILLAEMSLHMRRVPPGHQSEIEKAAHNYFHADLQDAEIIAADGSVLRGWYVQPQQYNGRAVVLLHGVGDNREGIAGYARMFLANGYSVLLPDSRAHGESGGEEATYGLKEANDVHRLVSWLYSTHSPTCVYGFGESMGAAIVLQAARVEPGFCAVVAESPFSTFRAVAFDRVGYFSGGLGPWFGRTIGRLPVEVALLYARIRYGLDLTQANPADAIQHSPVPILLIHGTRDVNILPRHSQALAQLDPKHAELWLVPGAAHCGGWGAGPKTFERRVVGWFAKYNSPSAPIARLEK